MWRDNTQIDGAVQIQPSNNYPLWLHGVACMAGECSRSGKLSGFSQPWLPTPHLGLDWFVAMSTHDTRPQSKATYVPSTSSHPGKARNLQIPRSIRNKVQHTAWVYTNGLNKNIQGSAKHPHVQRIRKHQEDARTSSEHDESLKCVNGEVITSKGQKMRRWMEH